MTRVLAIMLTLVSTRAAADFKVIQSDGGVSIARDIQCGANMTCSVSGSAVAFAASSGGGSTPSVTCAADEALTWNGSTWGCVSKVRAAYMADAGVTAQTADYATTASALSANPTDCAAGRYAIAIDSAGNLTCAQVAVAGINATGTPSSTTYLRGDGAWATPSGGGSSGVSWYGQGVGSGYAINVAAPGTTLHSKALTVTAGDRIVQSAIVSVVNNSGATATYTLQCRIGSTTLVSVSDSTTQATSATNRGHYRASCEYAVISSSSTLVTGRLERFASAAAGASGTGAVRSAWATSGGNWTGSQTFNLNLSSSTTTATQTAYVHSVRLEQVQNP